MSLILENVSFTFCSGTPFEKKVLENFSLTVQKGEFLGITGRCGSGKTTLLRLMAGLIKPQAGTVRSDEKTGLVFQFPEYQLFERTVLDDVSFGPLNLGYSKEKSQSLACEALTEIGIDETFYKRNPLKLSGGEKRRVAIAGILAMNPGIILFDEPDCALDDRGCEQLAVLLKKLNEQGKTIVVASHNPMILDLCRTGVCL